MKRFAIAGVCAGLLAAPLVAKAAELVLVNAAGQPVAVIVPLAQPMAMPMMPAALPMADIFAQQDAMVRRMMNSMQALQAAAFAAPGGMMNAGPGSTMVMSSFSSGQGSCSRTISYEAQPGSATPVVHIQQTGNACGAMPAANPRATVPVAEPEQERVAPRPAVPGNTRLYQIDYRHKAHTRQLRG